MKDVLRNDLSTCVMCTPECRDLNIHLKNPLKISSGNIINEVQSCVSRQLRSVEECTVYTVLFVQIAIDKKMS